MRTSWLEPYADLQRHFFAFPYPPSLLSAYLLLSARDDDTTRRRLQRIEEGARAVYDAMKPFDLNPAIAALILVLLYCLAVLAFGGHPRLPQGFVRLRKVFSVLYALASAATLFTFLGGAPARYSYWPPAS